MDSDKDQTVLPQTQEPRKRMAPEHSLIIQGGVLLFLLAALFIFWQKWYHRVDGEKQYIATKRNLILLDPPPWISPSFIDEVTEDYPGGFYGVNITDKEQIKTLFSALMHHPWVKRVESLEVSHPARILIRLTFREPIALVEVSKKQADLYGNQDKDGFYSIDSEGTLLPSDYLDTCLKMNPEAQYDYLWISGIESAPMGGYGEPWNDPAVENAALLAEFLSEGGTKLGIQKIIAPKTEEDSEFKVDPDFELTTAYGNKILWGSFPASPVVAVGKQLENDRYGALKKELFDSQRRKLDRLNQLVQEYDSLDNLPKDLLPLNLEETPEE